MPTPLTFETPDYASNETLKGFDSTDSLAKSYLDLKTRVDGGGIDLLPEEIRKDPAIATFKNVSELAKGYVETKKMVGGIKKAPEKLEDYKFTPMSNLHPNVKPEAIQGQLRAIAHKAGLHNEAADVVQQEVMSFLSNNAAQAEQARGELTKKNESTLRQEWGADYEKKMDGVINALNRAGGIQQTDIDAVSKAMKGAPTLMKALGKIVGLISEDSIGSLGDAGDKQVTDKTSAQAKIQELTKQIQTEGIKHPFHDGKHAKHDEFMAEWTRLHGLAYS